MLQLDLFFKSDANGAVTKIDENSRIFTQNLSTNFEICQTVLEEISNGVSFWLGELFTPRVRVATHILASSLSAPAVTEVPVQVYPCASAAFPPVLSPQAIGNEGVLVSVWINHRQDVIVRLQLFAVLDQVVNDVSHSCWRDPFPGVNAAVDPHRG